MTNSLLLLPPMEHSAASNMTVDWECGCAADEMLSAGSSRNLPFVHGTRMAVCHVCRSWKIRMKSWVIVKGWNARFNQILLRTARGPEIDSTNIYLTSANTESDTHLHSTSSIQVTATNVNEQACKPTSPSSSSSSLFPFDSLIIHAAFQYYEYCICKKGVCLQVCNWSFHWLEYGFESDYGGHLLLQAWNLAYSHSHNINPDQCTPEP